MQKIEIRLTSPILSQVQSLCGFLGSFDPFHRGHAWIVETLLERFDAVLLLIPAFHFEKSVRFPLNATFEQRLAMLASFIRQKQYPIAAGLAHEVLFIRLADCLAERFPNAEIFFGMGNETFERVLASKTYYKRLGLAWTAEEESKLERLRENIVIFGRSGSNAQFIVVPEYVRRISSTGIRETVMELRRASAPEAIWAKKLENIVSPEVLSFMTQNGLYCSV